MMYPLAVVTPGIMDRIQKTETERKGFIPLKYFPIDDFFP